MFQGVLAEIVQVIRILKQNDKVEFFSHITAFHTLSFHLLMELFNCSLKISNTINHTMIIQRNLLSHCFDNVSSTCHGKMVNDCSRVEGDPCWFLNKLHKTEQRIDASHIFSLVFYYLATWRLGKITVHVIKEDHFLALPNQVDKVFFQLLKGTVWITGCSM